MATFVQQNEAIRNLRRSFKNVPQRTLAKRIVSGNIPNWRHLKDEITSSRSFYSVYSIIRKHDSLLKQTSQTPAVTARPSYQPAPSSYRGC